MSAFQAWSDRTPISPACAASMPCTVAASPWTVVMHGMSRRMAAERIAQSTESNLDTARGALDDAQLKAGFAALLRQKLGVEMSVVLAAPGSLAPLTGIEVRQKPIRLIDKRFA